MVPQAVDTVQPRDETLSIRGGAMRTCLPTVGSAVESLNENPALRLAIEERKRHEIKARGQGKDEALRLQTRPPRRIATADKATDPTTAMPLWVAMPRAFEQISGSVGHAVRMPTTAAPVSIA